MFTKVESELKKNKQMKIKMPLNMIHGITCLYTHLEQFILILHLNFQNFQNFKTIYEIFENKICNIKGCDFFFYARLTF